MLGPRDDWPYKIGTYSMDIRIEVINIDTYEDITELFSARDQLSELITNPMNSLHYINDTNPYKIMARHIVDIDSPLIIVHVTQER